MRPGGPPLCYPELARRLPPRLTPWPQHSLDAPEPGSVSSLGPISISFYWKLLYRSKRIAWIAAPDPEHPRGRGGWPAWLQAPHGLARVCGFHKGWSGRRSRTIRAS